MDYQRIYSEFIADRKRRKFEGYTEQHHILPRSLGGGNEPDNLIPLSAEDHFFAHLLLAKIHGGAMWHALNMMANGPLVGERASSVRYMAMRRRWYGEAKAKFAKAHSQKMKGRFTGEEHPMFGKPCSPVALEKLKARIAAGFNPMQSEEVRRKVGARNKGKVLSAETREKIAAAKRGVRLSDETRARMSAGHTGKKRSPETIAKIAASNRGKKRTPEQVAAMRARLTGRKLSPEHIEKLRPHLAKCTRMKGKRHSPETRERMTAINAARREYAARFGCSPRGLTIDTMRKAGIDI